MAMSYIGTGLGQPPGAQSSTGTNQPSTQATARSVFGLTLTQSQKSRLDDAQATVVTLTAMAKSMRSARSDQATARLRQLLEQVKLLRMLSGDAKAAAKQAARLAKDIADAAKEFTAGTDPGLAADTTTPTTPTSSGASGADPSASTQATQAVAEATQVAQQATTQTATSPTQERKALVNGQIAAGDTAKARSQAITSEHEFFDQVKAAVSSLKAIIQRAAAETSAKHHGHNHREHAEQIKDVDRADQAVDTAIGTIGQHDEGDTTDGSASTEGASNGDTTPSSSTADGSGHDVNLVV